MKKLSFLISIILFISVVALAQEIKFETSIVTNSVALHPMIFDVDKDGKNDIVVVDDYNDLEGNDATNIKTVAWFSYQGIAGGEGYRRIVISEINYRSCGIAYADIDNDGDMDIVAPRNWNKAPLYLWRNLTNEKLNLSSIKISETNEQGIPSLKIETSSATYIYDKAGGGFISMFDKNGKDWISFKTADFPPPGNAASCYRGIPNLGIGGEDNDAGHPGFDMCITKVIAPNVIETTTKTGNWKFRWAFYDNYAKLIMVKTLPEMPYWFLYEGTPAGKYDPEKMYWGNNIDGLRKDFPDLLDNTGIFCNVNWLYVGQKDYPRILYFRQLQSDDKADLFSYMGNTPGGSKKSPDGMVCFGFGRAHHTTPVLHGDNLEFVIGFVDNEITTPDDNQLARTKIESVK